MQNPNDVTRLKHLDSLAGKVNILGTAPQTVNGGLWFDSDANAIKFFNNGEHFAIDLTPEPNQTEIIIADKSYRFTGFAHGLTLHDGNFYAADDTNHTTSLGTVTPISNGYTFNFTDIGAIGALADGATSQVIYIEQNNRYVPLTLDSSLLGNGTLAEADFATNMTLPKFYSITAGAGMTANTYTYNEFGGQKLTFTNFADDLAYVKDSDDITDGKVVYTINANNHQVGTLTVTLGKNSTLDTNYTKVAGYSFEITDAAAFSVSDGDTVSVAYDESVTDKPTLSLSVAIASTGDEKLWGDWNDGSYFYLSSKGTSSATYEKTSDTSYTYKSSTTGSTMGQQWFNLPYLKKGLGVGTATTKTISGETFNMYSSLKGVTVKETVDASGYITAVEFTFGADALPDNPTSTNTISSVEWDPELEEYINDTSGRGHYSGKTINVTTTIVEDLHREVSADTWTPESTAGTYTFESGTTKAGWYPDETPGKWIYDATSLAADKFTISGLASGLVMVKQADGTTYNFYKSSDCEEVKDTNDKITYKPNDEAKVLATLTNSSKDAQRLFTINDLSALNLTVDELAQVQAGTYTGNYAVQIVNVNTGNYEEMNFGVKFNINDTDLMTPNAAATTSTAQLVEDADNKGTYHYQPPITGWYFKSTSTKADGRSIANIYTYTYTPTTTTNDGVTPFTISGMAENLGEITFNGTDIQLADGTNIGRFFNGRLTLKAAALPTSMPNGHKISITPDKYTIRIDNYPYLPNVTFTGSDGSYTYSAEPTSGGCVVMNDDFPAWFGHSSTQSFTVTGLKNLSGTFSAERSSTTGVLFKVDDTVIGNVRGNVVTLNAAALPDNPTSGTTIQFTTNTFDYNFNLDSDVDARTFANEFISETATAGTYIYSANGSTAGWQVTPDGDKIIFAPELNGTTKILTGLRTDLGTLTFDESGRIHAQNGGIVGFMDGNQITWYQHALLIPMSGSSTCTDFDAALDEIFGMEE